MMFHIKFFIIFGVEGEKRKRKKNKEKRKNWRPNDIGVSLHPPPPSLLAFLAHNTQHAAWNRNKSMRAH
jgi:hypothetical protein